MFSPLGYLVVVPANRTFATVGMHVCLPQAEKGIEMPADKLGRYTTSPEFLRRANAAVTKAVRALEGRGIRPAYVNRSPGQIVGDGIDINREDTGVSGRAGPPDDQR
jgi:hypothetical protein